jgi:hypothetical protein
MAVFLCRFQGQLDRLRKLRQHQKARFHREPLSAETRQTGTKEDNEAEALTHPSIKAKTTESTTNTKCTFPTEFEAKQFVTGEFGATEEIHWQRSKLWLTELYST